ncbi:MAG: phytoene/squalene synthase family protein [Terrimonas sp.]|nr:phytoene/squalene synthase family protein [Terrimonas sp.]OJY98077.1 MAG: phytoene synthase [Sphingobacteriales bacterium 40-81]
MKELFDHVSARCSKITTREYSTSFSLGIKLLAKRFRQPIYAIYGFVRFADEIVDSFHNYDKTDLLKKFSAETYEAIDSGISLNPILNSFQHAVNTYAINRELINTFLDSMEMDLQQHFYTRTLYEKYIYGSAEAVGLMCLKVFCEGDEHLYNALTPPAMKLGSAFQKINFLRDIKADNEQLGRLYFPGVDLANFSKEDKWQIEHEIEKELAEALQGIKQLPASSGRGVYLAYHYYLALFKKIQNLPPVEIFSKRIRVNNVKKMGLLFNCMIRHQLNLL